MRAVVAALLISVMMTAGCSRARQEAQAQAPAAHSRASLVLEKSAAKPGSQVRTGIRIETDPGWHIYWKNPGDSGEAPRMKWELGEGVTAGPLEWPAPVRMTNAAGADYGYEGAAVLLTSLAIPATVKAGTNIAVGGDLRWLVCHDVCIPQQAELKADLKVAGAEASDARAQASLEAAARRIPGPLPQGVRVSVESSGDRFELRFAGDRSKQVVFFPEDAELIDNAAPQHRADTHGEIRLELKKSDHLQGDPARLKGVLVDGEKAYEVNAPVVSSVALKDVQRKEKTR